MDKLRRLLERIQTDRLENNYDALIPVLGSEGVGKSTLMLQATILHQRGRGIDPDAESVLDRIVWNDRREFKNALAGTEHGSVVMAHDAARVLHKREAMRGDQVEIEKDLLDIRTKNLLMLLGFQDWGVIPTMIQERRANFVLRIPTRGKVEGYSRDKIDERVDTGEWPEPSLVDSFPSLDGTDVWEAFVETDEEKKSERIEAEDDPDPDEAAQREKIRAALRACQPWRPRGQPMTQEEAGRIVGMSGSWVSRKCRELERGYHRDLVADLPGAPEPVDGNSLADESADPEGVEG